MPAQFDYPRDFQDTILACYIRHTDEFSRYGSLMDPAYFQGALATDTARCVQKFFQERARFPGWSALTQMLCETVKRRGDDEEKAIDYIEELKSKDTKDLDYVISQLRNFAKQRAVLNVIRDAILKAQKHEELNSEMIDALEKALDVGADLEDDGILLHADYGKVIDEVTDVKYGVKTGFPQLDKVWPRGLGPGWLVVPLAPPKRFKSLFISQMALNMIRPGSDADVLYYPCEINQSLALIRMLQRITELEIDELYLDPERFKARVKVRLQEVCSGNLLMKGYASKTANMRDIEAHAKRVIQRYKLKPKAVFIDYAETILSTSGEDTSEHQSQAQVYVDARAMGDRLGCAIIMPDRCNKETVGMAVPSMKSFQGSFQKAGVVDAAIGLCASDLEYSRQIQRTFIFLNRHGEAFQHYRGKVDASIMSYDIGEKVEYVPEDDDGGGRRRRSGGQAALPTGLMSDGS